jgi:excisionase family DNA binding protein
MVKKEKNTIEPDSYSVKEFARLKGVHVNTVYSWILTHEIPESEVWRKGRTIRILKNNAG